MSINIDKKPMLPGIYGAIKELFHNPPDPFFTGRVMDILYDGVPIDCTSEDMTVKAMCTSFSTGAQQAIRQIDNEHYAFSLFGGVSFAAINVYKNAFVNGFTVSRPTTPTWANSLCSGVRK